jgi:hypothetical protein
MSLHEDADKARPLTPGHGSWATFEARVRARRVGTCLERASALMDDGSLEEARQALNEARVLAPDALEIVELEHKIAAQSSPDPVPLSADEMPVESPADWSLVAAIAIVLGLFFLAGLSVVKLRHRFTVPEVLSTSGLPSAPDTVTESPKAPLTPATAPPEPNEPASVAAVGVPRVAVAATGQPATKTESRARPAGVPKRSRTPAAPPTATIGRSWRTPLPPVTSEPQPPIRSGNGARPEVKPVDEASPVDAVALKIASPTPTATTGAHPMATLDALVPASSATSNGGSRYDESQRIRAVLLRYETAFNRLDAMAASAVWPGVNESALKRAFSGLVSQKVSLGSCDITVIGDIAGASCAGQARWEPKIGGGLRTADRYWTFQLRKSAEGWRIKEVLVR